eukprot:2142790-Rhodomonas_salina.1
MDEREFKNMGILTFKRMVAESFQISLKFVRIENVQQSERRGRGLLATTIDVETKAATTETDTKLLASLVERVYDRLSEHGYAPVRMSVIGLEQGNSQFEAPVLQVSNLIATQQRKVGEELDIDIVYKEIFDFSWEDEPVFSLHNVTGHQWYTVQRLPDKFRIRGTAAEEDEGEYVMEIVATSGVRNVSQRFTLSIKADEEDPDPLDEKIAWKVAVDIIIPICSIGGLCSGAGLYRNYIASVCDKFKFTRSPRVTDSEICSDTPPARPFPAQPPLRDKLVRRQSGLSVGMTRQEEREQYVQQGSDSEEECEHRFERPGRSV